MTLQQARDWALVVRERPFLMKRVSRRVHEPYVDDVFQLVMLRAWIIITEDRATFGNARDPIAAVRAWLTLVVRGVFSDWIRSLTARGIPGGVELHEDIAGDDPIARIEARETLARIPRGLTKRDREILNAFARNGGHYAETAAELGIPAGSLSTRIREIRRYLRKRRAFDK